MRSDWEDDRRAKTKDKLFEVETPFAQQIWLTLENWLVALCQNEVISSSPRAFPFECSMLSYPSISISGTPEPAQSNLDNRFLLILLTRVPVLLGGPHGIPRTVPWLPAFRSASSVPAGTPTASYFSVVFCDTRRV